VEGQKTTWSGRCKFKRDGFLGSPSTGERATIAGYSADTRRATLACSPRSILAALTPLPLVTNLVAR
jgi:hypothetical protein